MPFYFLSKKFTEIHMTHPTVMKMQYLIMTNNAMEREIISKCCIFISRFYIRASFLMDVSSVSSMGTICTCCWPFLFLLLCCCFFVLFICRMQLN